MEALIGQVRLLLSLTVVLMLSIWTPICNATIVSVSAGHAGSWAEIETEGATIYNASGSVQGKILWSSVPPSFDYDHVFVLSNEKGTSLYSREGQEIATLPIAPADVSTASGSVYIAVLESKELTVCNLSGEIVNKVEQVHSTSDAYGSLFAASDGAMIATYLRGHRIAECLGTNETFALGEFFVALLWNKIITMNGLNGQRFGGIKEKFDQLSACDAAVAGLGEEGLAVFTLFGEEIYRNKQLKTGPETILSSRGRQLVVGPLEDGTVLRLTSEIPWDKCYSNRLFSTLKEQADQSYKTKDYEIAEFQFLAAIQTAQGIDDKELADTWCWVGDSRRHLHRHKGAVEAYETALTFNPDDPNVHNGLGASCARLGRRDDTLNAFCRAAKLGNRLAIKNLNNWAQICSEYNWPPPIEKEKEQIDQALSGIR